MIKYIMCTHCIIKAHGSESQGQEEAAYMRVFWPPQPNSELFTQMAALNFENTVTQTKLSQLSKIS